MFGKFKAGGCTKYALFWAAAIAAAAVACRGVSEGAPVTDGIPGADGRGRYIELMRAAMSSNDTADWRAVENEAALRSDTPGVCMAKLNRVICLSNFASPAVTVEEARRQLPYILSSRRYVTYFSMYKLLVDGLVQQRLYDDARQETENMLLEAGRLGYDAGKALALLTYGTIYCKLGLYQKAFEALDEGIRVCPAYTVAENQSGNIFKLLAEWGAVTALKARNYGRLSDYAALLDEYFRWSVHSGKNDPASHRRVTVLAFRALAFLGEGRTAEAASLLGEAEGCIDPAIPARAYEHFYEARRELRRATGDYEGALADADTLLATHRGYFPFWLDDMLEKARLLAVAGRAAESNELYRDYILAKDSINRVDIAAQLDRVRTLYEVDRLETEKRLSQQKAAWAVAACLLLGLSLASYMVYSHRLREKNRVLYQRIREQEQRETDMEQVIRTLPQENLTRDLRLFMQLNELLRSEELFTDPALSRDTLAARLGTNRTYLSDAVRACADGLTVREYLNLIRLKYAGRLLSESDGVSVEQVCHDAGFTSRSVFYRLFREQYGMSPARFRDLSGKS